MITEVLAYDSDRLPDDSKHKHLSRPMYLLLFLLVYTCGESLYAQDFSGIVVHGYVSRENPEEFRSQWRKVVFTGQGAMPKAFDSESALIEYVADTPGAVGYVSRISQQDRVKLLAAVK